MADVKQTLNGFIDYASPQLSTFLVRTWKNQQQAITYKELRSAIYAGQLDMTYLTQWQQDYSKFIVNAYAPLAQQAIDHAAQGIISKYGVGVKDVTPGFIDQFIATNGGKLIREVSETQYKAVNVLVRRASMSDTMTVDELARAIRPTIGLTTRQSQAAMHVYEQAIVDGYPPKKARNIQAQYAERMHRRRAATIAQTEMAYAYNAGQLETVRQAIKDGLIAGAQKKWSTSLDELVCDECGPLNGQTVDIEANFPNGLLVPPAHPNCRCTVSYILTPATAFQTQTATAQPAAPVQMTPDQMLGDTKYGYTPEQRQEMADEIANAETEEVRQLWMQSVGDLGSVNQNFDLGGGQYDPSSKDVYFRISENVAGTKYSNPYALGFHEYGHKIDSLYGEKLYGALGYPELSEKYIDPVTKKTLSQIIMQESRGLVKNFYEGDMVSAIEDALTYTDLFGDVSSNDMCLKWLRGWMKSQGISGRTKTGRALMKELSNALSPGYTQKTAFFATVHPEIGRAIFDEVLDVRGSEDESVLLNIFCGSVKQKLSEKERVDISDMFEPFSAIYGIKFPFGAGHGFAYALGAKNLAAESFAEMFSASIAQKESLAQIKNYYPEAYRVFLDMIRSVLTP